MVPGPASFRSHAVVAVLALLALVGMHVLDMNVHTCHSSSAHAAEDGGHHEDGHEHHKGSGAASCVVVGCVAIVLSGVVAAATHRRRPRSVWPALVAAISSVTRGPEPPVPRILLTV